MFQIIALGFALYHVVVQLPSGVQLFVTPWTVAFQAPLSMGFPRQEYWKVKVKLLSHVQLFVTPWTVAYQVPLSMGFFQARVLEWVCHFLLQEIFPTRGLNPRLQQGISISFSRGSSQTRYWTCVSCLSDGFITPEPPGKPTLYYNIGLILRLCGGEVTANSIILYVQVQRESMSPQ